MRTSVCGLACILLEMDRTWFTYLFKVPSSKLTYRDMTSTDINYRRNSPVNSVFSLRSLSTSGLSLLFAFPIVLS